MPRKKQRVKSLRTVTLQILVNAPSHDLSHDPMKDACRQRRGDIIDIMLTPPHATREGNDWRWNTPITSTNLRFVHMRDVPNDRWHNMRTRFTETLTKNNVGGAEDPPDETDDAHHVRARRWRWKIEDMAGPKHNEFMNAGETTYSWTAARSMIVRKRFNDVLDPSLDDQTPVQDDDLPGAAG